jgi:hypothetical protein
MEKDVMRLQKADLAGLQVEICKDLVCEELDGEMVILDLDSKLYFGIDAVGSRIWQMLEEKVPPSAMIDILLEEYEVEADPCRRKVMAFLADLEKNNLITLSTI